MPCSSSSADGSQTFVASVEDLGFFNKNGCRFFSIPKSEREKGNHHR